MSTLFALPQVTCSLEEKSCSTEKISLAVAGGRAPSPAYLKDMVRLCPAAELFCADKGADYALAAGLVPRLLVGDEDSGSHITYERCAALGTQIEKHDPLKDATDLQLLLAKLPSAPLIISGIWGGRFDHLFSALYSLLSWQQRQGQPCPVFLADEAEVLLLARGGEKWTFALKEPKKAEAVSLLPFTETAFASIEGVRWPLKGACLKQLQPYAVSNVLTAGGSNFTACCEDGALGIYLKFFA